MQNQISIKNYAVALCTEMCNKSYASGNSHSFSQFPYILYVCSIPVLHPNTLNVWLQNRLKTDFISGRAGFFASAIRQ